MAPDRRLQERFRRLAEALSPDLVLMQERAVRGALNADGTLRPDALTNVLPWQVRDFHISGEAFVGNTFGGIFEFPQGARIERVSARLRNAPTTAPFTYLLVVNGTPTDYAGSIQPGATSEASGASIAVPPGGVVTLNVTSAGDARDVTISIFYSVGVQQ